MGIMYLGSIFYGLPLSSPVSIGGVEHSFTNVKEGNVFQRLEGLMLAAPMEITEIKKRNEELEDEENSLEAAAKMYEDIQAAYSSEA